MTGDRRSFSGTDRSVTFASIQWLSRLVPISGDEFSDLVQILVDDLKVSFRAASDALEEAAQQNRFFLVGK